MAEQLHVTEGDKTQKYENLLPQITALIEGEEDIIANMANISAALKQTFGFFWVGFYRVQGDQLILGPFQGPVACNRIRKGRGVCGTAWAEARTILVTDVEQFPGHIACSSDSRSEIVVPVFQDGDIIAVLDIDSDLLNDFDEVDVHYLERICKKLKEES